MRHALVVVVSLAVATLCTLPAAAQAPAPSPSPVMTKLDNPRGLAFGPDGALFVAEAGYGGAPCDAPPPNTPALSCYGLSGAISRLWHGQQDRLATGLPSVAFRFGASARGPHDIALRLRRGPSWSVLGGLGADVTIGLEADPATRETLDRPNLGKLVHIPLSALYAPSGSVCDKSCWKPTVDIAANEIGGGPDGGVAESDPYGLIVEPPAHQGGHDDVVVDASGNALLRVNPDGEISLLAVFPSRSTTPPRQVPPGVILTDSVPTAVTIGPDGAYYVGELAGIPFAGATRDKSNVYRVEPGQDPYHPTVLLDGHVTGFNAIIDIAFKGSDLYVLQHWTLDPTTLAMAPGRLVRVACGGRPLVCDGLHPTTILDGLDGPTAILFGPDGALYLSNHGASPGVNKLTSKHEPIGEVLRIDLGYGASDDDHDVDDDHDGHGDERR